MKKLYCTIAIALLISIISCNNSVLAVSSANKTTMTKEVTKEQTNYSRFPFINWTITDARKNIDRIGNKLLDSNNINVPINIIVKKVDNVNAYADGQNNIVVYYGIVPYCANEDELAFIIAHEMGHIFSKHCKKSLRAYKISTYASEILGMTTAILTRNSSSYSAVRNASRIGAKMGTNKYSRVQEKEADLLAVDFLVKAGYNPYLGKEILGRIGDSYVDFFKDHPSPEKRLAYIDEYIKRKYPQYMDKNK